MFRSVTLGGTPTMVVTFDAKPGARATTNQQPLTTFQP
jgi:hypothetical protein